MENGDFTMDFMEMNKNHEESLVRKLYISRYIQFSKIKE